MGKDVPASIILPDAYDGDSTSLWPVVYILHGAGGSHRRYIDEADLGLSSYADKFGVIIVCADGGKTSWWFDSPIDPSFRYETHVAKELVPWVDAHYRTFTSRDKRVIMGVSMGGHGACWVGFRHKEKFGAVGLIAGGVDLWGFPNKWDIAKRLGPRDEFPDRWREHSAVAEAAKLKNGEVEIVAIIGTSDFFLAPNRKMHKILSHNKVAHTYGEMRGPDDKSSGHDFSFTAIALPHVFSFFRTYFDTGRGDIVASPVAAFGATTVEDAKFELSLKQKPGAQAHGISSAEADDVVRKKLPNGDDEFTFTYRDSAAPVRTARVTLRRDAEGAVRHKISCEMRSGWFLASTMFPVIDIPCEEATHLVLGSNKGGVFHDPSKWPVGRWQGCKSPGSSCAPFAAAWNDESGRYIGIEDAKGYMKSFGFNRTEKGIRFSLQELTWTTGSYTQDYWVVTRRVAKGAEPLRWYDFADIYKAWDRQQTWSKTPLLARADIPAWMKDAPAFTRFSRQWLGRADAIRKFVDWWKRDIGDKPVVAALWGWEKVGTWWGPDYFPCYPSDEVFTATMKELRGRDFHPFAWPSGYNWSKVIGDKGDGTYEWDGREKFIKPAESHLVVEENGSLCHVPAFWLRNGALTTLCGGDPWSHGWWNNLTKELARRHCDIVQFDQVVGGRIRTCWSPAHGHPVGNGLWMWQTFRRQMEEMHAAIKSVEPDGLIGVEEPNMMYNDLVGIQDYRDLESSAEEFASVYSYLYHGYVPMFQSNPFRDEFFSLAHAATDGQMPFYKPDFAELEPSRPALRNGGFENLVDSVRGPDGWDRLIPSRMLRGVDADKPLWNFSGCSNMGWLGYAATLEYGDKHGGDVSLRFDVPAEGGRDNGKPVQVTQTVNGLEPGRYTLSAWVKTLDGAVSGSLKYGICDGETGEIAFPSAAGWTKVSAEVDTRAQLRLVIWAPPGAKFLIDDVRLDRDGREVVFSGDSPYTKFMKKWIALYQGEGKDFLANGFRVKPPALTCDTFRFAGRQERTVCYAAYESPSGELALALANATDRPQRVTGEWEGRLIDITLPQHDIRLVNNLKK